MNRKELEPQVVISAPAPAPALGGNLISASRLRFRNTGTYINAFTVWLFIYEL